jgi:peptide-methionine (R)-S-oxide reductase
MFPMGRSLGNRGWLLLLGGVLWSSTFAILATAQDPFQPSGDGAAIDRDKDQGEAAKSSARAKSSAGSITARSRETERVVKTNEEWRKLLSLEQFMVTRMKATEPAFSGKYASGHFKGTFECVCCGAPLFESAHKFDSGTGWPSFFRPANDRALETAMDYSEAAEARVEVVCRRCGAHLGHVFQDGPPPTGLRYCINSVSLKLDPEKPAAAATRKTARPSATRSTRRTRPSAAKAADPKAETSGAEEPAPAREAPR